MFFLEPNALNLAVLMVVPVQTTGSTFSVGNPTKVFDTAYAPIAARVGTTIGTVAVDAVRFEAVN